MVHGLGFRDQILVFNYWGRIAKNIEDMGERVYYGKNDAWGSIYDSAMSIKKSVDEALEINKAKKINIIAHSRGGLDCRYLISTLGYADKIASLTTISTPHKGSKSLNIMHSAPDWIISIVSLFVNTYFKILGDKKPKFGIACKELSEISSIEFNKNNPNESNVYYQSFGSKLNSPFNDMMFFILNILICIIDDENDGIVSLESAKWDNFKAITPRNESKGLSHSDVVDLRRRDRFGFDICGFYKNIIVGLAEKGF